ncbi:hypothetical protein KXX30_004763 [Aspergillus fumigatus]|nr:hypothetical protein KXX30_004763 [Aspergillus fumigatus]
MPPPDQLWGLFQSYMLWGIVSNMGEGGLPPCRLIDSLTGTPIGWSVTDAGIFDYSSNASTSVSDWAVLAHRNRGYAVISVPGSLPYETVCAGFRSPRMKHSRVAGIVAGWDEISGWRDIR